MPHSRGRRQQSSARRCARIRNPRAKDACMRAEAERQRNADMQAQQEMADREARGRG